MARRPNNASAKLVLRHDPREAPAANHTAQTVSDERARQRRLLDEAQKRALQSEANRRVLLELAKR